VPTRTKTRHGERAPSTSRGASKPFTEQSGRRLWGVDGAGVEGRIGDLAELLGLEHLLDRAVESYTGGQRRRLGIARALVSRPRVLFLDERSSTSRRWGSTRGSGWSCWMRSPRAREEMTIVLTTHYLEAAQQLCDRVPIMHAGRIAALNMRHAARRPGRGAAGVTRRRRGRAGARRDRRRRRGRIRGRFHAHRPTARGVRRRSSGRHRPSGAGHRSGQHTAPDTR
jgi:ABC-type multidrug transport system ATPase subunit